MPFTSYLNKKVLNETFSAPTNLYVALFTSANIEVTGNGYARQPITFATPSTSGISASVSNDSEIRFPIATGAWGEIKEVAIFDAASGGNKLDQTVLNVPRTVDENDQFVIAQGNYKITLE